MDTMDFEIELQEEQDEEESNTQLPLNYLTFGEIANDDVNVYIKQDVYKKLEKLAASDTSKELGSIILGDYCEEMGKQHVIISEYIEAKYTDASASTLTFTHETWDYVHKRHEKKYPDKKIIGWQHTHPNYGIFLSNYDMFIQENFFNLPFQVAYVIDPIQNLRGFFQWKNGKVEKLNGYYIYDEVGQPIKIEQTKVEKKETQKTSVASMVMTGVIAILCALVVVLGVSAINLNNRYKTQVAIQEATAQQLADVQANVMDLQAQLAGSATEEESTVAGNEENIVLKYYTVEAGDTLVSICEKNGIDYAMNKKTIMSLNGIENANQIYAGQVLLLPVSEK